jgi:hypothetical protein
MVPTPLTSVPVPALLGPDVAALAGTPNDTTSAAITGSKPRQPSNRLILIHRHLFCFKFLIALIYPIN